VIYIAPHNQNYYLVILVIPFYVAIDRTRSVFGKRRSYIWAALSISYLLVGWPLALRAVTWLSNNILRTNWHYDYIGPRLLSLSVPLVGTVLLLGVLVTVSKQNEDPTGGAESPIRALS
jgi:hypothetical protein